jgi:ADP-heptose:LPS heptosyltransferase
VDEVIWLERKRYLTNPFYSYKILKKVRNEGFSVVFNPTFWRDYYIDAIPKVSGAESRWGSNFYGPYYTKGQIKYSNAVYNQLLHLNENDFEFYKFQSAVSQFLKISFSSTQNANFEINKIRILDSDENEFIIISPGANADFRRWPTGNFGDLCNQILSKRKVPIFIIGSASELILAEEIISKISNQFQQLVFNKVGEFSLSELTYVMSKAKLFIGNDSGPFHLSVAVGTPSICISNGNHYKRFVPYPENWNTKSLTVLPPAFQELSEIEKVNLTKLQSTFQIKDVTTKEVMKAIEDLGMPL